MESVIVSIASRVYEMLALIGRGIVEVLVKLKRAVTAKLWLITDYNQKSLYLACIKGTVIRKCMPIT